MRIVADVIHRSLPWDSRMLGFACGTVDVSEDAEDGPALARRILGAVPDDQVLTLVKLPVRYPCTLNALVRNGADVIDVECVFVHALPCPAPPPPEIARMVERHEGDDFLALAEEMHHSRFMRDTRICRELAVGLWRESIANHCRGRASALAVGYAAGRPGGLVAARDNQAGRSLFLVGVLPEFRRQGLGMGMLRVMAAAPGPRPLKVEALAGNRAAVELYGRAGFRLQGMRHVLHLWREQKDFACLGASGAAVLNAVEPGS